MSCQYSPQFLNKPLVYDIACQYSPQLEETVDRSKKDRSFKFQDSTNSIKNKENISETPSIVLLFNFGVCIMSRTLAEWNGASMAFIIMIIFLLLSVIKFC